MCVYLIPPKNALLGWYGSLEYIHSKVVEMIAVWELINVLSVIQCRNEQTCMFVYRRCRGVRHPGGRHPRGDLLRGSYHHLITIRVYGFIVPQILIPVAKLRSMLPLLPGRVPIYRSRFAASHTYPIVGTLHPLEVNLLSGDLGDCSFLFRRKLWMMGTDIPLDITSLQCCCIYLHCGASACHSWDN